jgi:hypothetical protein
LNTKGYHKQPTYIPNLDIRWRSVVSFTSQPLQLPGTNLPSTHWISRVGPIPHLEAFKKEKYLLLLSVIELWFLGRPPCSIVHYTDLCDRVASVATYKCIGRRYLPWHRASSYKCLCSTDALIY